MTKTLPPLYALRAFEAVVRSGSVTRAADELGITQSAVSKHLKTLEDHFDRKLFTRSGPRLRATPDARIMAEELKQAFRQIGDASAAFRGQRAALRVKAPSTLTMRWLLPCLRRFRETAPEFEVEISSVWMDIDSIDFFAEPYDCAILLGAGQFGAGTSSEKLFDELLIPICAPGLAPQGVADLARYSLIHPSPDRRDWRRWLQKAGGGADLDIMRGQVFDTLEQGTAAAMAGHGISVGDLGLCADALAAGQLALPFGTAVATGDAYCLIWPDSSRKRAWIQQFLAFLRGQVPRMDHPGVACVV